MWIQGDLHAAAVENHDRHFADGPGIRRLDDAEREQVEAACADYLETIPERKRHHSISYRVKDVVGRMGAGIGSAGLRPTTSSSKATLRRCRMTWCSP